MLTTPYTAKEVKKALFCIPENKASGLDGFGRHFSRDAWEFIGRDITDASLDVLRGRKLLKELNATVTALVPKIKCLSNVSDTRPIFCYKTIYKCITKVICGSLRNILPDIIVENQGRFVHGRYIVHNIMVVQDIAKENGRKLASPSFMINFDLEKAYNILN